MKTTKALGWALGLLLLPGQVLYSQEAPAPPVEVSHFAEAPEIDGHLDEALWQAATVLDNFRQIEPSPGAAATEATEVRVGYDEEKIYIGARCYVEDPSTIDSKLLERDTLLQSEDSLHFIFDTFNDRTNGFYFAVNVAGAQVDALVRGDGDDVNYSWDAVWDSATSRDSKGWTAEIAIPFRSLRFNEAEEHIWGFNVQRYSTHNREYTLWQPTEASRPLQAIFKVSQAGRLAGMKGLRHGSSWDLMPYVLARAERSDSNGDDEDVDVGIDIKRGLTSTLTLDLTYNLDFAETEIDAQQTNLTRFPLFYPEKRDFFLENANNFYFGERPDRVRASQNIFFFSRRVGLTEDGRRQIPVLGGVKLSGQAGGIDLGVLTLSTDDFAYRGRDGQELFEPETNYSVVRLKKDVWKRSSLGLIWLNKAVKDGPDSGSAGVDWDFGLTKYLKTGGFFARSESPTGTTDWAGMADLVWESDAFYLRGSYLDIGEDFDSTMGFFKRLGVREWHGALVRNIHSPTPRLGPLSLIGEFTRVTDQDGELESQNSWFEVGIQSKKWAGLFFILYDDIEVLEVPFEVSPGVVIPPGRYHFTSPFIGAQGTPGGAFFPFVRYRWGEFYDGDFSTFVFGFRTRPARGLFSRFFYEHTDVSLPYGDFVIDFVSVNVTYALSPKLSGKAIVEWRKNDNLSANVGVRWEYRPGAAFYLVYNEFRDLLDPSGDDSHERDRSLIVKTTFFF